MVSRTRRELIFERDEYTCQYCGKTIWNILDEKGLNGDGLTIDHVIPKIEGGTEHPTNLVTACTPCNHKKARQVWVPIRKPEPITERNHNAMRNYVWEFLPYMRLFVRIGPGIKGRKSKFKGTITIRNWVSTVELHNIYKHKVALIRIVINLKFRKKQCGPKA